MNKHEQENILLCKEREVTGTGKTGRESQGMREISSLKKNKERRNNFFYLSGCRFFFPLFLNWCSHGGWSLQAPYVMCAHVSYKQASLVGMNSAYNSQFPSKLLTMFLKPQSLDIHSLTWPNMIGATHQYVILYWKGWNHIWITAHHCKKTQILL